jgi:hypothetical protein
MDSRASKERMKQYDEKVRAYERENTEYVNFLSANKSLSRSRTWRNQPQKIKRRKKNSRSTRQMKKGSSSLHLSITPLIIQRTKQSTSRSRDSRNKNSARSTISTGPPTPRNKENIQN